MIQVSKQKYLLDKVQDILQHASAMGTDDPIPTNMKYTVKPMVLEGCDCEDCRSGKFLYSLYRINDDGEQECAFTLHSYSSAEECKYHHYWGIPFGPDDIWEDGAPIRAQKPIPPARRDGRGEGSFMPLNGQALQECAERMMKHWQ